MTVRVLVVEHDTHCPPALFGTWLADAGAVVEVCRPYVGDQLPVHHRTTTRCSCWAGRWTPTTTATRGWSPPGR